MKRTIPIRTKVSLVLFGFVIFLILLETGMRLGGFIVLSLQEYRNLQSIRHGGTYRILCLGESTTQGQYPGFLEEILNQRYKETRFCVIDKGLGGIKTSVIVTQLTSNLAAYAPNMVVVMMGINDGGAHIPYEKDNASYIAAFFSSFRTYKLARLLWLHACRKACLGKAPAMRPDNDRAYVKSGFSHWEQHQLPQAEDSFKKAIALNPRNEGAYIGLGLLYQDWRQFSQAQDSFKKAIGLNPCNDEAYLRLGWLYQYQQQLSQAEISYKKAIELNPRSDGAYLKLGYLYRMQGKYTQARDSVRRAVEIAPDNDGAYGALALLCDEMGDPAQASAYAQKADRLRSETFNPVTVQNYRTLKGILDKKGIRLVCVQYPMRSIQPLKKIFQGRQEGVVFVDNERIFRDAVKKDGYLAYFNDMFGGDFGHCTAKGNRLLAERIAEAILKDVFHPSQ